MAKSRVEKNKQLYDNIELESFEIKDITESTPAQTEAKTTAEQEEVIERQEIVVVEDDAYQNMLEDKSEDSYVVEQPISYTSKLSIEEILRAKLEKQQKLKDSKKGYKKTPYTKAYTPQDMQKNINQVEGIDIRKEANITVKEHHNGAIISLVILLIAIIVGGAIFAYMIL